MGPPEDPKYFFDEKINKCNGIENHTYVRLSLLLQKLSLSMYGLHSYPTVFLLNK